MPKTGLKEKRRGLSIRFPVKIYDTVKANARSNRRSYGEEVIILIEKALRSQNGKKS